MALATEQDIIDNLHLDAEVAMDVAAPVNLSRAERQLREWLTDVDYEDIRDNKQAGDDEYDRVAQAEALVAFASYIGNRGGIRLSQKGGLVRDLGLVNQQQTIRQLLSQNQIEQVQGRLLSQAEALLDDLRSAESILWAL